MIDKLEQFAQSLDDVVARQPQQQATQQQPQQQPQQQQEIQATSNEAEQTDPTTQPQEEESFQARNFRELRNFTQKLKAEKERIAKENEELKKFVAQQQNTQAQPMPYDDDDGNFGIDDEIAEKKDVKRVYKTAKQALAEQKRLQAQLYALQVEREIEKEIPDYYSVVNSETVSALRDIDPEMAQVIASYPDLKVQAKAAYKAIKANNLHKMADYETPKKVMQQNKQRPPTTPSTAQQGGETPLARAMDYSGGTLTEQMKKQFYLDMKKAQMGRL